MSKTVKPTILIADDDMSTRMLLRAAISQWDYPVIEANDGEEAWEILQRDNSPKIATVDWMMPKIDGVDLCRRTKKLAKPPYMILLTCVSGSANVVNALDSGADDFLTKPFNYVELRSRLHVGQRIINFTNKLEDLVDVNKSNSNLTDNHLSLITDKVNGLSEKLYEKWAVLHQHIKNMSELKSEDQLVLRQLAIDVSFEHEQLSEEIKSMVSMIKKNT